MIDLAKMVEEIATAGQPQPTAGTRLVCIGWISRSNLEDYQVDPENALPPMLWRKPSRHADQPVYVIGREDG